MNSLLLNTLAIIKGHILTNKSSVNVMCNKSSLNLVKLLYKYGYISNYKKVGSKLIITLKYIENFSTIRNIEFLSTPGRKLYLKSNNLILNNRISNFSIISTNKGLLNFLDAYLLNVGGKILVKLNQ